MAENISGKDVFGFRPDGVVKNLTLDGLRIKSLVRNRNAKQTAIGHYSGLISSGLRYNNIHVEGTNVGIYFGAHLAGSCDDVIVSSCFVKDIFGTESGSGYGIVFAGATNVIVQDCLEDNAERHGFYCGYTYKNRIANIKLLRNKSINHRKNVYVGGLRASFVISRSHDVTLENNTVENGFDSGLEISQVNNDPAPKASSDCYNITVNGFNFINRQNDVPFIGLGEQQAAFPYILNNIKLTNINCITDESIDLVFPSSIWLMNGQNISLENVNISHINNSKQGYVRRGMTLGDFRYSPTLEYINNIIVNNPKFNLGDFGRPITIDGALKNSNASYTIPQPIYVEP